MSILQRVEGARQRAAVGGVNVSLWHDRWRKKVLQHRGQSELGIRQCQDAFRAINHILKLLKQSQNNVNLDVELTYLK